MSNHLDISSEREGWGRDTYGGCDGALYPVTTVDDSGKGSIRYALEASEPLYLHFMLGGKFAMRSSVFPKPNKTIDGRGHSIQIKGNGKDIIPFRLWNTHNIVMLNLTFDDEWPNYGADSEGADGVNIKDAADFWFHHCFFQRWSDGCIDMNGNVERVTVSRCKIWNDWQALACQGNKITICKSWGRNLGARFPKAIGGFVHSYNNLIHDWKVQSIQSAKGTGGQLLAEYNMYWPGSVAEVNDAVDGGRIRVSSAYKVNPVTMIGGNDTLDASLTADSRARAKMTKPADKAAWNVLLNEIRAKAGCTLPAVAFQATTEPPPAKPPLPPTLEERVTSLEARVAALEAVG